MTATDELRKLLDERGVGCVTDDGEYAKRTTWHGVGDKRATFVEYANGECRFAMDDYQITPEQAIAATLGAGTCSYIGDDVSGGCSECRGWLDPACAYCPSCGRKVEG